MGTRPRLVAWVALLLWAGPWLGVASAGTLGVTVALSPAGEEVAPGATVDLDVQVTQAGDPFNGFDLVIGFDAAVLTPVPLNPVSQQVGSYMSGACGNTFHLFHAHPGIDTATVVLLCNGVSLTGPGTIYHLRFQASSTPQVTALQFLTGTNFYNGGLYVRPVNSSGAEIGIGMPVGVAPAPVTGLTLTAAPNPSAAGVVFTAGGDRAGPESLTVFDAQGRIVRRFGDARSGPGVREFRWDARDEAGARLAPGVYLARLELGGRSIDCRVALTR